MSRFIGGRALHLQVLLILVGLVAALASPSPAGAGETSRGEVSYTGFSLVQSTSERSTAVSISGSVRGGAGGQVRLETNRGGVNTVGISRFSTFSTVFMGGVTLSEGRMTPIKYRVTLKGGRVCPTGTQWVYVDHFNHISTILPSCFN